MKFLHCSDLHLGRLLHGYSLLEDQQVILEQILTLAKEKGADALLIAGDVYDRSAPSSQAVELLDVFLTQAAEQGIPCFLTAGNHDSPERVAYGGALMRQREIYVAPKLSGGLEPIPFTRGGETVDVYLLPFLKPAYVRALWPEEEIDDYTQAVEAVLRHSVRNPAHRQVLVAHQFVVSGDAAPLRSDSESLSVGGLDQVDGSVFDGFDYVALGHIHAPQAVGRETVRYSGSPLKYSISEADQKKSAALVTLTEDGGVTVELCPFRPLRDLRQIQGPLDKLTAPEVVAQANREDYIHAILTDPAPVEPMARLSAVYPHVIKIDIQTAAVGAEPLEELAALERQNVAELFADFFAQQTGVTLDQEERRLVAELLSEEGME